MNKTIPIILAVVMIGSAILYTIFSSTPEPPEDSCSQFVTVEEGPDRTPYEIHVACSYFEQRTGRTADLTNVTVNLSRTPDCPSGVPACAHVLPFPPHIEVQSNTPKWKQYLHHEVWHVLLWRAEPWVHPDDHHLRMKELGLCKPHRLCGY